MRNDHAKRIRNGATGAGKALSSAGGAIKVGPNAHDQVVLMQIASRIAPRQPRAVQGAIPAIIHQTFETHDIAERMHAAAMTWVEKNPDFEYHYSSNEDRRALIAAHFAPEVLAAYDKLDNGAFRADLWRYCQLYVTGGVYADIDAICEMPLSSLLAPEESFVSARAGNLAHAVFNGFICAAPGHPFLKAAIDRATGIINTASEPIDGYMTTGPWNLGVSMNAALGRKEKAEHMLGQTRANGFVFRLLEKHPRNGPTPSYLTHEGQTVLLTEYPDYREDLKDSGLTHWRDMDRYKKTAPWPRRIARKLKRRFFG